MSDAGAGERDAGARQERRHQFNVPPQYAALGKIIRQRGACVGKDSRLFFPQGDFKEIIAKAKAICDSCEVRLECLEYAIGTNQSEGIWGGKTEAERKRLTRLIGKKAINK